MCNRERLVFIKEEGVLGVLTDGLGAHSSLVWFFHDGQESEYYLDNDEFEIMEEATIDGDTD